MTHTGPSGRVSMRDRDALYNDLSSGMSNSWSENIANAQANWYNTGELLILQWIIDDGTLDRGHRTNLFTRKQLQVGIGIYPGTSNGQRVDRVTMVHVENAPCTRCSGFSKQVNDNMCWTNFAAG